MLSSLRSSMLTFWCQEWWSVCANLRVPNFMAANCQFIRSSDSRPCSRQAKIGLGFETPLTPGHKLQFTRATAADLPRSIMTRTIKSKPPVQTGQEADWRPDPCGSGSVSKPGPGRVERSVQRWKAHAKCWIATGHRTQAFHFGSQLVTPSWHWLGLHRRSDLWQQTSC